MEWSGGRGEGGKSHQHPTSESASKSGCDSPLSLGNGDFDAVQSLACAVDSLEQEKSSSRARIWGFNFPCLALREIAVSEERDRVAYVCMLARVEWHDSKKGKMRLTCVPE